jgi:UDP-N-acetylglucosamine enolpyruvyl transferase
MAEANVQDIYSGNVKITGQAKAEKVTGKVMTEAMRLARNLVKDAMKANKIKISTVKASDITAAAKKFIEADPTIIESAKKNLAAREATPTKVDIMSLIHVDPALVAKAEAKAAAAKADKPLSAKQAGKVAPRAKTKPPVTAPTVAHGHTAH